MSKRKNYAAIICIQDSFLLEALDFEGGKVLSIRKQDDMYKPNEIEIVIEHPDLPDVVTGSMLTRLYPAYHFSLRGYNRTEPPKKYRRVRSRK